MYFPISAVQVLGWQENWLHDLRLHVERSVNLELWAVTPCSVCGSTGPSNAPRLHAVCVGALALPMLQDSMQCVWQHWPSQCTKTPCSVCGSTGPPNAPRLHAVCVAALALPMHQDSMQCVWQHWPSQCTKTPCSVCGSTGPPNAPRLHAVCVAALALPMHQDSMQCVWQHWPSQCTTNEMSKHTMEQYCTAYTG